jgi:hypothetical protein
MLRKYAVHKCQQNNAYEDFGRNICHWCEYTVLVIQFWGCEKNTEISSALFDD